MTANSAFEGIFAGNSEIAERLRNLDWTTSPLGPPDRWPQSLRSIIRMMLTSRYQMWMGWGPELAYLYNDAYRPTLGVKHPWSLGKPVATVWQEIWDDIGPLIRNVLETGEAHYREGMLLLLERSGLPEETYHTFSYSPLFDDDGSIAGLFCVVVEETERVLSERRLATIRELASSFAGIQTEAALFAAVEMRLSENLRDLPFTLTYLLDDDGETARLVCSTGIEAGHPAAPAAVGIEQALWPFKELLGSTPAVVVSDLGENFAELPSGGWDKAPEEALLVPIAQQAHDRSAAGFMVVGLNPYRAGDQTLRDFIRLLAGQIASALATVRAYEEERRRAAALAEIDRAKTVFFSNVSHEFRTPLTLMLGPLEEVLAKSPGSLDRGDQRLIEVAHRNGLRLIKLVNGLLDFSRIEAGRVQAAFRPTDIAAFTAELASNFRSATDKAGLRLKIDTGAVSAPVYLDRDMWEKIVLNLLSNAFKFTLEGEIAVELRQVGDLVQLTVRDTGIGIPEHDISRLFERFHRVEGANGRSYEGSGIGLALVQELVRLHGGEVTIESELGKGTAFHVSLALGKVHLPPEQVSEDPEDISVGPRANAFVEEALLWLPAGEAAQSQSILSDSSDASTGRIAADGKRPRVVLADDNQDMRDYVARLLTRRYEVEAVRNGEAALAAIRRERPDLVLTDVMMPELDGFGLLREVRADEQLHDLPVVLLSARAGEEAQVQGLEAGADDYLVKPFSARELLARVTSTLELSRARRSAAESLERLNQRLADETERLSRMFSQAPTFMAMLRGPEHVFELVNPAYEQLIGHRKVVGKCVREALPEVDSQGFIELLDEVYRSGEAYVGEAMPVEIQPRPGGPVNQCFLDFVYQPITGSDGEVTGIFVQGSDVTERKRAEQLRTIQTQVLQLALQDARLEAVLDQLVTTVETSSSSGMIASILLLDGDGVHLRHGAAPSLPGAYNETIDGIAIGPSVGSCGTAAYTRKPVYVADIEADPRWTDFKDVASSHGLRACWSTPITDGGGKVLGTFAMYYPEPREPSSWDKELVQVITRTVAVIIERSRAATALRASEARLRALVNATSDVVYRMSPDWSEMRQLDGRGFVADTDSVRTNWIDHYIDSADHEFVWSNIRKAIRDKSVFQLEHRVRRVDGTFGWTLSRAVPLLSESGEIIEWFGTAADISERKSAEERLREETHNLETLNRTGAAIASELDLERVVQLVTDAGVELTSAQFGAFFYNVTDSTGESYMLYTLSGVDRSAFENFPMPRNTKVFGPTFAGEGIVRSDDITKDRRYGKNPPYNGKPKGHLPVVSYLALPVMSRTSEVIGGLFFGHSEPAQFTERHEHLMQGIAAQAAIAIDNAQLYQAAQREVEERTRIEEMLRDLNETLESRVADEMSHRAEAEDALRQAQKMETLGQLTGGVAHDFNNLLQIVTGNLELLRQNIPEDASFLSRYLDRAATGAERAASLTQRLLAFSRRQPLAPKRVDVNRLLPGMSDLLHRTLGETIEIEAVLSPRVWPVEADANQLENAIINLAINARDAMPDGGKLTIETQNTYLDGDYASTNPEVIEGQYVVICISDTGLGMDAETVKRAIEPFFTTKEVGKGTGLGLSMVYGFVKQSGGHLKIYSEPGEGTTIKVYLPRLVGESSEEAQEPSHNINPKGDETILVCEDDDGVRAYSVEVLQELGYSVVEAPDGPSALRLFEAGDQHFDLLFTDVVLPSGITGAVLAAEATKLQPNLKVLFTTGYARNAIVHQGRLDPGVALLTKPFSYADLASRVRDILDKKSD